MSFWNELKKPIFALAPLANVTDPAFRHIIAKYSKIPGGEPFVMWTEFVSADGLILASQKGKEKLMKDLIFTDIERPIIAQFFTSKPEIIYKATKLAVELGFDGIDINMGCPDCTIEKQGAGAALMKNPELALELIRSAKKAVADSHSSIPVSIKTRLGYNKIEIENWIPKLLSVSPDVITLHLRTRKEMSKVPAQWELAKKTVEMRNQANSKTLIFGNGDALDLADAKKKALYSGVDGVMLGRAIFGRPWLFSNSHEYDNKDDPEVRRRILSILIEHTELFEKILGGVKSFAVMKKHFKAYVDGFPNAKEVRVKLMEASDVNELKNIINNLS